MLLTSAVVLTLIHLSSGMNARQPAMQPMQWTEYTIHNPNGARIEAGSVWHLSDLETVNREVNHNIRPMPGFPPVGDVWTPWRSPGWCGDYTVTKRELLLRLGWPSSMLLVAEVKTAFGEPHAVLVVMLPKGPVVLDNRVDAIRAPERTGYKFVKIQSRENPNDWLAFH